MRLGLVARSDNSGLGIQTWEFYRHMHPAKTMVVDISKLNGNKTYNERYSPTDSVYIRGFPTAHDIDEFLKDLDLVFIAEAAYNPYLYTRAKELGVKTANQYNYEFFDWFNQTTPKPDMLIAPSRWHYDEIDDFCKTNNIKHTYLHCPVNRDVLPFREIKQARKFLHIAGRSAAYDRNGTETVIDASKYVKSDVEIIIHFQGEQGLAHQATSTIKDYVERLERTGNSDKVTIQTIDFENYFDVYQQGDVMILPRRYGGNCLPLNEALSVGMPIVMPDISPNMYLLPSNWRVPAQQIGQFEPRTVVDIYGVNPIELAKKIDEFAEMNESQMLAHNKLAGLFADAISWDNYKAEYEKELVQLCQSQ